jgi:hypothetical protein
VGAGPLGAGKNRDQPPDRAAPAYTGQVVACSLGRCTPDVTFAGVTDPNQVTNQRVGSGDRGTAVFRVRYHPDDKWWAISVYELRDGRISQSRGFFAPDFEAPDWRAPYSEAL